jgi:hypothetical protein
MDSSFGLDLIMNKDKQKRRPSPGPSPSAFTPVDEPKSSFSNNMYSNIDSNTPNLTNNFDMDSYLEDELKDININRPSINKIPSTSSSPIDLKPPSGGGLSFNFDDDVLTDNRRPAQEEQRFNQPPQMNSYNTQSYNSNEAPMSVEEMQRKKFDLLCKLERLKRKGVIIPRTYTMNSPYEEIKYEYEKLHNERLMDNSVKMYRQMLVSATTAVEYPT